MFRGQLVNLKRGTKTQKNTGSDEPTSMIIGPESARSVLTCVQDVGRIHNGPEPGPEKCCSNPCYDVRPEGFEPPTY